jgi:hypothetical protein
MDWNDVRVFLAVARNGSMRAAGRTLGLSQPTVLHSIRLLTEFPGRSLRQPGVSWTRLAFRSEKRRRCNHIKTWYAPLVFRPQLFLRGLRLLFGDHAMCWAGVATMFKGEPS